MAQAVGYDSVEESVSEGGSLSSPVSVTARETDVAYVYIDDGSGSAVTESYSLTVDVKKAVPHDSNTDYVWSDIEVGISGSTAKFHEISSFPSSIEARLDLTNESDTGSSQNYRIIFETINTGAD